jgi:hypothetical protein
MSPSISPAQKAGTPAVPRPMTRDTSATIVGPGEAQATAKIPAKVSTAQRLMPSFLAWS